VAELLKDRFSAEFILALGGAVTLEQPGFDPSGFEAAVFEGHFEELGLKARVARIAAALSRFLPEGLEEALDPLFRVHRGFPGLPGLVFAEFVAQRGLSDKDFDVSMEALARFTVGSSSEFGVRPFIRRDPGRAMAFLRKWSRSPDEQVRRLASEGSRPRLPWGGVIEQFKADPAPVLELLDTLLADPSQYVQKSVANSLNDVSKDHPEAFLGFARPRLGKGRVSDWILRRGGRTLVKKKHGEALRLFGYALSPKRPQGMCESASLTIAPGEPRIGSSVTLAYSVRLSEGFGGLARVEYLLKYPLSPGGRPRSKLFFLKETLAGKGAEISGSRRVHFRDLSVRKQVPGEHGIELLLNGEVAASGSFTLVR
jgi:3-methyladenine DNA glycosylase AlkC